MKCCGILCTYGGRGLNGRHFGGNDFKYVLFQRDVCRVTGTVFQCRQDTYFFKNIFNHFWFENEHFQPKKANLICVLTVKSPNE